MADLYLNTSNDNNVDANSEDFIFEAGCADGSLEDNNLAIHEDIPFQDSNIAINTDFSLQDTAFHGTNVIDHSIIPSAEDSAIPYKLNCFIPLSY